eukprot:scaffold1130_cov195-Pinguiococcus_pyrenoidosus.AAC.16
MSFGAAAGEVLFLKYLKDFLQVGLIFVGPSVCTLPSGVFMYWITNGLWTAVSMLHVAEVSEARLTLCLCACGRCRDSELCSGTPRSSGPPCEQRNVVETCLWLGDRVAARRDDAKRAQLARVAGRRRRCAGRTDGHRRIGTDSPVFF